MSTAPGAGADVTTRTEPAPPTPDAAGTERGQPPGDGVTAGQAAPGATAEAEQPRPRRGRPRKDASRNIELVLTVTGSAAGVDWRADVAHGTKRIVRGLSIPASAVAAAAKELHPEVAEAIEGTIRAATEHQRTRVEQLRAELEAAQRALADLES